MTLHRANLWGDGTMLSKIVKERLQSNWDGGEHAELVYMGDLFFYTGAAHQFSRRKIKQVIGERVLRPREIREDSKTNIFGEGKEKRHDIG